MNETLPLQIILIAAATMLAQWTAWRWRVPAIVFLLGAGFILGPATDLVQPSLLLGDLLKPAIAGAVAIILFEGSIQLRFHELRETRRAVWHVIMLGAPIGWGLISLAAHYIAGLEWPVAITLGGILVVTGPTVIIPMLREARLNARIGSVLKWEGIVNDPLGVIFAVLAYEYFVVIQAGYTPLEFLAKNGAILLAVSGVSFALAHVIKWVLERGHMPEYLKTSFLLTVVLGLFFACDMALHESGLIAVTILGVTLTNIHTESMEEIKRFKENITLLLVSGVFILLTANLDASVLLNIDARGIAFILAVLFLIRPLTFLICSPGSNMSWKETLFAGLIAPRGIVCAAMAGVLGPLLIDAGFEAGEKILPIAFAVVVVSVVLHSLMIKPLARKLNLTSEEENGVIFAGAYPWSIQFAEVLKAQDIPVLIADDDWNALKNARLADVPVYYGELLSSESEFALEFNRYDTLLAAKTNAAYNTLVCEHFSYEFGSERVSMISPNDSDVPERQKIAQERRGRAFVSQDTTLFDLWSKFNDGWRFRITRVGKPDDEKELIIPEENENRILIGVISSSGQITLYSDGPHSRQAPGEDDYVIVFEKDEQAAQDTKAT